MKNVVIVDSVRTGLAKSHRGGFNMTRTDEMLAHIIYEMLDRNNEIPAEAVKILLCDAEILKVHKVIILAEMLQYYLSYQ